MTDSQTNPPSRIPWPPLLLVASGALGALGHFYLWPIPLGITWPHLVGWALVMAACTITLFAHHELEKGRTTIRPDRPATALVSTGPFAWSRNPLYVALTLLNIGLALVINGLVPLLFAGLLWLALNFYAVPREERHLAARFPEAYAAYRARVRRWI